MVGKIGREGFPGGNMHGLSYGKVDKVGKDIPGKGNGMCKSLEADLMILVGFQPGSFQGSSN